MAHLRYAIENDLATVILNNPPQNRLSAEMLDDLAHGLDVISRSARITRSGSAGISAPEEPPSSGSGSCWVLYRR
jgi:hypothetical protein